MSDSHTRELLRWQKIQSLFHEAVSLSLPERISFLRNVTQSDPSILADLTAMLREDDNSASVLDRPIADLADSVLAKLPASFSQDDFRQYRILKLLGEGGSGVVYLAERADLGSVAAIKILSSGTLSPSRRQRFADEQRTLAQLDHPFIARILDADTLRDGTPWFAMEYVEGQPISAYCQSQNCSIQRRLALFRAACDAVRYAHAHAFIHRDLKPSNILVRSDGVVKLLDFGIAKRLADREQPGLTNTGLRPMTLAYASPEQILGEQINTQSDVYSLGIILYELLTTRLPFDLANSSPLEAERIVLDHSPEPPSASLYNAASLSRSARADLDVLCLTAMHRDPQRRYRSAEALIRDIDHYLKDEPLEARPDSLRYRLGKFVGRNKRPLAAVLTALVVIAAVTLFFTIRLTRERSRVLAEAQRTQRIERFMLNLFNGGDKTAGPAGNLRAVTLIDRGVRNARALRNEPAVQADLFETLGTIYRNLGKLDNADPLLNSSVQQQKSLHGADSAEEAQALVSLGLLRLDQSRVADAEKLVREGLDMSRRHLPPDDPQVAAAMSVLGRVLNDRVRSAEAIQLLQQAIRLQSRQGGPSSELSTSIQQLGDAEYHSGHYAAAESLDHQALTMDRQLYGNIHPRVADDLIDLGIIRHDLGDNVRAEQFYRQALAIMQAYYGADHPETAMSMSAVGEALTYQGRLDEAAVFIHRALTIQEQFYGKVHTQVGMGLNILGMLDFKRKHFKEAEAEFTRMGEIDRSIYGPRSYLVCAASLNLGWVYVEEGNYTRAENSDRFALNCFLENLPPTHLYVAIARARLGHVFLMQRRYEEAETYIAAGYKSLTQLPSPPEDRLAEPRSDLAKLQEILHHSAAK